MRLLLVLLFNLWGLQAAQLDGAVRFNSGTSGTNTTSGGVTISSRTNLNAGALNATNSVNVGQAGETGVMTLSSTNGTHTLSLSLLSDGTLTVTNDSTLVATIALNSLYDGTGDLFLSSDGTYKEVTAPPGTVVTNININPTDGFDAVRSNATTFRDGNWYWIRSDTLGYAATNYNLVVNSTNMLFGDRDYNLTTGSLSNTAFGYRTLASLTTGDRNTAVGTRALANITTPQENTAIGTFALMENLTGGQNTAIGNYAMRENLTGQGNTAVGSSALASLTNGTGNTVVGYVAAPGALGSDNTVIGGGAASNLSTGSRNTIIGKAAEGLPAGTGTNEISIGYAAVGKGDNAVMIGNTSNGDIYLPNNIHLDRSVTNVLYRSGTDLIYTNGATATAFSVINGSANRLDLGITAGGIPIVSGTGSTLYFSNASGDPVALSPTSIQGGNSRSLGSSASSGGWLDLYLAGQIVVIGAGVGTANYERLAIDHTATTNGVVYTTQAAGSGAYANQTFGIGTTNYIQINPSETANFTGLLLRENGTMSRVKVGAAGTGPGGSGRALYVD